MSIIYGVIAAISFILLIGFCAFIKKKNIWMLLLFVAVFAVNTGYFTLSISKTLEEALLANRLAYLGSVFLPLCMLLVIREVCRMKDKQWFVGMLTFTSIIVFIIAASPGYTTWYYADVELLFVDGVATLDKVYGPLHIIYLFYLLFYFSMMLGTIFYAYRKNMSIIYKYAGLLTAVVFLNISIWFIEQLVSFDFEFLSISYIVSEMILLLLYGVIQDLEGLHSCIVSGVHTSDVLNIDIEEKSEEINVNPLSSFDKFLNECPVVEKLTSKERDVLKSILLNKKRKEIAEDFSVSENTIKKHITHIHQKLNINNRDDLMEIVKEYQ